MSLRFAIESSAMLLLRLLLLFSPPLRLPRSSPPSSLSFLLFFPLPLPLPRHSPLARHGRSLAACLVENGMEDSLCTFVSHAHGYDAHIRLTQRWIDTLPPLTPGQQAQMEELLEDKQET